MRLLHIIRSVDAHTGGPIEGVKQFAAEYRRRGIEAEVASLDAPEDPCVSNFPLSVVALGPGKGKYGFDAKLVPWLTANAARYDHVIVNGIWQFHSYAVWQAAQQVEFRYSVFLHGMLDPWFKQTYPLKHLKKWLYWPWAEYRVLRDAQAVLFTTEEERLLARESFWLYRCTEKVIGYGINDPPVASRDVDLFVQHPELRGKRVVLFMGRIHPKKGCDHLIRAFAQASSCDPLLHLAIAGPDEVGWRSELDRLAHELDVASRISWLGMVTGAMKWQAYRASEVFFLPSHQENFGIVVAEALACGVPVLTTNKVNIWREIEANEAGFIDRDDVDGAIRLMRRWLNLELTEREHMGRMAHRCYRENFTPSRAVGNLIGHIEEGRR